MMAEVKDISHIGKIIGIDSEFTTVEIVSSSACAACHASALCGVSENKVKVIEVPTSPSHLFEVGDEVEVVLKASMGHKAVWLAYLLPLLVLVTVLLSSMQAGAGELLSALLSLGATALYYFILFLYRDNLKNEYVFTLKEIKNKTE